MKETYTHTHTESTAYLSKDSGQETFVKAQDSFILQNRADGLFAGFVAACLQVLFDILGGDTDQASSLNCVYIY